MKAGGSQLKPALLIFVFYLCFCASLHLAELQVCERCSGVVLNDTAVGNFCSSSAGRIDGRCCLKHDNTTDTERIIGLDLSNCSLTFVDDLQEASSAIMIDLSVNPKINISSTAFQGFLDLNYVIVPQEIACPGGNASWEKVNVTGDNRYCEGQISVCNNTGHMAVTCPENSLCGPYGPGLFECSCAENYHGYKCLREGEFPALQVFGPLGASMVVTSLLLWVTQRRKVKSQ